MSAYLSSLIGRIPYTFLLQTTWSYLRGRRVSFVISYGLFTIANGIRMLEPLLLARVLNKVQTGGEGMLRDVTISLAFFFSLSFFFWIFHGSARIVERQNAFFVHKLATERLFKFLHHLPLKWHRLNHSGDVINRVQKATGALFRFSGSGYEYLYTITKFIVALGAVIAYLPLYGSLALLMGGAILFIILRFNKTLTASRRTIMERENRVMAALIDYIGNITTVTTLRLGKAAARDLNKRLMRVYPEYQRNIRLNEIKWFSVSMLVTFTTFALMALYVRQQYLATGTVLVGSLIALYQYISALSESFLRMAGQLDEVAWGATDVHAVDPIVTSPVIASSNRKKAALTGDWREILIDNLRFGYDDASAGKRHLQDVTLRLRRGSHVALIGESGSGKSTLMSLLRGLEHPDHARLRIDDREYHDLSPLAAMTTLIPQHPELFESTIGYNLTTGMQAQDSDILRACDIARFTPVLDRLPKGLRAQVRERGANMSGGEKQRLALARGILAARNSSLILLDEPTSAIDPANELAIYKELFAVFRDRCIISSIHRLHLLPLFDEIVVMDKGAVVEYGNFTELVSKEDGALRRMWDRYSAHGGTSVSASADVVVKEAVAV